MKKHLKRLLLLIALPLSAFSQIPNPSFEDWTDSVPDLWLINNSAPSLLPVTQSTDAYAGNYAIRGEIVDDSGLAFGPFLQPYSTNLGFPIVQNHSMLYGWYKGDLIGSNLGLIEVWAYDSSGNQVGVGVTYLATTSSYQQFAIPIVYLPGSSASEMSIIIQMTDTASTGQFNVGSYFLIDDLSYIPGVNTIDETGKNFYSVGPNPAADRLTINAQFSEPVKQLVTIYDPSGKIVLRKSANNSSSIDMDVSSLATGCYLLTVTDGRHAKSEKIVISW